ncbi:MAG: glycoprotein [hymenopteran phasma-related virus OKIAV252]|uniref:glycoprotein n=1 Tax=hymenopteran phasma-related virus OKIAV252 TaxID=2847802 RepID=UPI0024846CEB|nr:MAG: glycoprotein [hymenopteran phasma-related virus OKIAV252]WBM84629.1 MAG: glycoprotein [hymenopteran phasma-related virus OKIAV252]
MFIGLLILLLKVLQALSETAYLRPLFLPEEVTETEKYDIMKLKDYGHEYIPNSGCNDNGCKVEYEKSCLLLLKDGFGKNYIVSGMGLMNKSFEMFVSDVQYNVPLEYMYTNVLAKPYSTWTTENYDPEGYSNCKNNKETGDMITADLSLIDQSYWVVDTKSYLRSYSPTSGNAYKCNHYWLTRLNLCARKTMAIIPKDALVIYKVTSEVTVKAKITLRMGDDIITRDYTGTGNEPETIEFNEGIKLEVEPLGDIYNPLNDHNIICHTDLSKIKNSDKLICNQWYHYTGAPTKGIIPNSGIGLYQLVNLNSPEKLLYDKSLIDWDGTLTYCTDSNKVEKTGSLDYNAYLSAENDLLSIAKNIYFGTQDFKSVVHKRLYANLTSSFKNLNYFSRDKDCCLYLKSSSNRYIQSCIDNMQKLAEQDLKAYQLLPKEIQLNGGLPQRLDYVSPDITVKEVNGIFVIKGYELNYERSHLVVNKARITKMVIYQSGAGSYFEFEIDYTGPAGNLNIKSTEIQLLKTQIYIQSTGTITDTIGFKSSGLIFTSPIVCFGSNEVCVKADKIETRQPSDGDIDDPDSSEGSGTIVKNYLFLNIVFSNWITAITFVIMWVIDILSMLVLIVILMRLSKKIFRYCFFLIPFNAKGETITPSFATCNNLRVGVMQEYLGFNKEDYILDHVIVMKNMATVFDDQMAIDDYANSEVTCLKLEIYSNRTSKEINLKVNKTLHVPTPMRYPRADYKFVLVSKKEPEYNLHTGNDAIKIINDMLKGKIYSNDIMSIQDDMMYKVFTTDIDSYNQEQYILFTNKVILTPVMELIDYKFIGPNSNVVLTLATGVNIGNHVQVYQYLSNVMSFKGQMSLGCSYDQALDLQLIVCLIECVDSCSVKTNININKVFKSSVHKLKPINKEEYFSDIKGYISSYSKGFKNKLIMAGNFEPENFDMRVLKKYGIHIEIPVSRLIMIANPRIGISSDVNMMDVNIRTNMLHTPEGSYRVVVGEGPITLECIYLEKFSYCHDKSSSFYGLLADKSFSRLSGSKILYSNKTLTYSYDKFTVKVRPDTDGCNGDLFITGKNNIICSDSCCLITDNGWRSFQIVEPDKSLKINKPYLSSIIANKKEFYLAQYKQGITSDAKIAIHKGCSIAGFQETMDCLWVNYPINMFFTFYTPLLCVFIFLMSLIIRILMAITGCCKSKKLHVKNKMLLNRLADSLLLSRPEKTNNDYKMRKYLKRV